MSIKIPVLSAFKKQNFIHLQVEDNLELKDVTAKEQMLVDSEHFAFIYILEKEQEYTYLVLNEDLWPILKEGIQESIPVLLKNQNGMLTLPMFNEELMYLIENIKGNSNYGEEMVEKVENTF